MVRPRADGELVEGFQVHLGGGLGSDRPAGPQDPGAEGRRGRTCPTTSSGSAGRYLAQRQAGETFAAWARRAEEDDLR